MTIVHTVNFIELQQRMTFKKYRALIKAWREAGLSESTIGRIAGGVSVYTVRQLLFKNSYRPKRSTLDKIINGIDKFLSLSHEL